ncbi:hypothetical protein ACWEN6_39665 [Sphaerisporangium sp. NPDC004334]
MVEVTRHHVHPFNDARFPADLGAVVNRQVAGGQVPALVVIHDDEGDWSVGDGETDGDVGNSIVLHISHVDAQDPTPGETAMLPAGHVAWRPSASNPWIIEPWAYPDEIQ